MQTRETVAHDLTWYCYAWRPVLGTLLADDLGVAGGEGSWPYFVLVCDPASAVRFRRLAAWPELDVLMPTAIPLGERLAVWALVAALVLLAVVFVAISVILALVGWAWRKAGETHVRS